MLVAPVLLIVLTGALYIRELYVARASTRITARGCAWELAMRGCEGDPPAACHARPGFGGPEGAPDIAATARQEVGGRVDPFSEFPLLGEAFRALFGTSTRATAFEAVPFPFDEERVGVARAQAVVLCNTVPRDVLEMATTWLEEVLP